MEEYSPKEEGRGDLSNRLTALSLSGMNIPHNNSSQNLVNQDDDALVRIQYREQEIVQLRNHLSEYAVKEANVHNENIILEKRIALMRKAFDQQQQDLIEATAKAIAYRQDIIEENVRLSYALHDAREEASMFISSLIPLLSQFSLNPPVADAESIVSNLRTLFTHFTERLKLDEAKIRESRYQVPPWQFDTNPSSSQNHRMDYPDPDADPDPYLDSSPQSTATQSNFAESPDTIDLNVMGKGHEELLVRAAFLPSIREEPSSSLPDQEQDDEGDDDGSSVEFNNQNALPAIEGLQIFGDPFPGQELQASGYSINGTTHCGFEWIRHFEDGSINYINSAKQPTYTVTADDVDAYLAVEVQPLDDNQRKGELVKCFANDHRKITCDPDTRYHIEKTLNSGQVSYQLSLWAGTTDIWEHAMLDMKTKGFTIRRNGSNSNSSVVVTEKFSEATVVSIPTEIPVEFSVISSGGVRWYLRTEHNSNDASHSRDTIVLTMRLFIRRAIERKKGKKRRVLFFTK